MSEQIKVCIEIFDEAASGYLSAYFAKSNYFSVISSFPYYADIYLLEVGDDFGDSLLKMRNYLEINPSLDIIVFSHHQTQSRILEFVNAGARGYMILPLSVSKFENTIDLILKRNSKSSSATRTFSTVFSVLSTKGGAGATTLGVNLGSLLQKHSDTIFLDLHQPNGNSHVMLNIKPLHSMGYLAREIHRLDSSLLTDVASRHKSGLSLIPPVASFGEISSTSVEALNSVLEVSKKAFSYVVIDHGSSVGDANVSYLAQSDYVVLVCQSDLLSLRNTKNYLEFLSDFHMKSDCKVCVVVNRYDTNSKVSEVEISEFLKTDIFHVVPNDYKRVTSCCFSGDVLYDKYPDSKIASSYVSLTSKLLGEQLGVQDTGAFGLLSSVKKYFTKV